MSKPPFCSTISTTMCQGLFHDKTVILCIFILFSIFHEIVTVFEIVLDNIYDNKREL